MPRKSGSRTAPQHELNFTALVEAIRRVDAECATQAARTVNLALTLRNWLIGSYIAVYQLGGADRAKYGDNLFSELAARLQHLGVSNAGRRQLYSYLAFYRAYPEIVRTVQAQFRHLLPAAHHARESQKVRTLSAQLGVPLDKLIRSLSYSHLELLVEIEDSIKRTFYEIECIRGNWSVRQLKRQIASLYFERSGLSRDKKKLAALVRAGAEQSEPKLAIRDPYVFEFLGIKPKEVMSESTLEDALLDKLQEFLLELGHGFCFEAQQKSILIGNTRGFVDLVFYHRVLKCHILIELKVDEFRHEHVGQLNTYVTWYRKHMMAEGDNAPIGLLLCTQKDHALVEYALAGMDNHLFVSKYQLALPSKEDLQRFLEAQRRELADE